MMILPIQTPPTYLPTKLCPLFPFPSTPTKHLISLPQKTPQKFPILQCLPPKQTNNNPFQDIDMVPNKHGMFIPKQTKVVILWDLDNKPPRGPPYEAAVSLRNVASKFGEVVDMSAYANRHAFTHLPSWVRDERRERRRMDNIERKGGVVSGVGGEEYRCKVCGRKCRSHMDLKKHFKELHERERQKKLSRMRMLKGKKRQKFKERYVEKNGKFEEAARELIVPKSGYGLAKELRRAGVFVKTVEDKPQAADWALKRQMVHSMSRGIDWLVLVSDDSDFKDMLRKAREASLGTVVVGDMDRALGKCADLWVSWVEVENGEVCEKDLVPKRKGEVEWGDEGVGLDDGLFSVSRFEGSGDSGSDLDGIVNGEGDGRRFSVFSEGEEDEDWDDDEDDDGFDFDDDEEESD